MNATEEQLCSHCGIPFRWKPLHDSPDAPEIFCCRGCLGAYRLILSAGLESFYQRSTRELPTVAGQGPVCSREELAAAVVSEGELCRLELLVTGISCPSCIWLLERMIARVAGVQDVSFTYAAGIAAIRFDPAETEPVEICSVITVLGFGARPYSPELSEQEERRLRTDLLIRFGTALFLTMQLMAYSYGLYAGYFQGIGASIRTVLQYASCAVATPVVFYCGWPFLAGAWRSLQSRRPGMDLLIAVGSLSAWLYSCRALLAGQETYFESAAMIVTFVLVGRLLEQSVRRSAGAGVRALYAAVPQRATLVTGDVCREIPAEEVRPGNNLLVRQGDRFPVDCLVLDGPAEVDQSLVNGESMPVIVSGGGEVRAGSINVSAPVTVQALRPVGQSYLMRMAALVTMAQSGKPLLQNLADRIAGWFVPAVLLLAVAVYFQRTLLGGDDSSRALMTSLAIVLIACPCAMGLAVPAAVLAACSRASALGIIFRGGDVIERLAAVQQCLLDKTGTITMGQPQVVSCQACDGFSRQELLRCLATVEERSSHPMARALVAYAADAGVRPEECHEYESIPGRGVRGRTSDGRRVLCGSAVLLREEGLAVADPAGMDGDTRVLVAIDGRLAGLCVLKDRVRPGAVELIRELAGQGIAARIVSGDAPAVVERIAEQIGIASRSGNLTPDDKLELVRELQGRGERVLMVGDGVNDALALAAADVSCTLTGSSDIALEQADVIVTSADISGVATARRIATAAMTIIRQNLAWAFLYNIIGIPLALSGHLTPVYASIAMVASSLLVSLNSLRLMRISRNG